MGNAYVHRGANLAPIGLELLSSPALDVSLTRVVLRFTNVDVSLAWGILMLIWGANLAPVGLGFSYFPSLDVSLAQVILRFTNVDVSLAWEDLCA